MLAADTALAAGAALAPALASHAQEPPRLDAVVGTNDGFDIGAQRQRRHARRDGYYVLYSLVPEQIAPLSVALLRFLGQRP